MIDLVSSANERYNFSSPVFPSGSKVLIVSPIFLKSHVGDRENDIEEARKLGTLYRSIAEKKGVSFLDATQYAESSKVDGVHLGVDGHRELGTAIADKIASLQI